MKLRMSSSGDFTNMREWITRVSKDDDKGFLTDAGTKGVRNLSMNTPVRTGETAGSWVFDIVKTSKGYDVNWYNHGHLDKSVNIAIILDKGYATRTGGYVPPRPYIKRSMGEVWNDIDTIVEKGLIK